MEELGMNRESGRSTLIRHLKKRRVCSKMTSESLSIQEKIRK
jgi:hypothetical protein